MNKMVFLIKDMDCSEEVKALKKELIPLVGDEARLSFDVLERKMTVVDAASLTAEDIKQAVSRTGMQAVVWDEACREGTCGIGESLWKRHGRTIACLLSGLLTFLGFIIEAARQGNVITVLAGPEAVDAFTLTPAKIFYLPAIIAGGWYIAPKALYALRRLRPDMNLLMTIAVLGALGIGHWLEGASVTFLFSLALLLESWSVGRARRAIKALLEISPATARFVRPSDGEIEEKPVDEVPVGAIVLVRPGERIPLDGIITKGETSVDQAAITGESLPVNKKVGDEVFAGTINLEGALEFRSTKQASDTTLARIIHMVEEAHSRRAPAEQWVDRFAKVYTPAMIGMAFLMASVPPLLFSSPWQSWLYQALVMLVIACPCSLVISTPVTIVAGLTSAARSGVLIKGGAFLEAPSSLKAIAFDKTGTLTHGKPSIKAIIPLNNHSEGELLGRAAALEVNSTHPFARAILEHAAALDLQYPRAEEFVIFPGEGAQGVINQKNYWIGSHRMLARFGKEDHELNQIQNRLEDSGLSVVAIWCEDHVCGVVGIGDTVRSDAKTTIEALAKLGIEKMVMITGDNHRVAQNVAMMTGLKDYRADLLPEDKVNFIKEARENLGNVAMVGDGVNDAPAMAESSLGIAMGAAGSDAAIESADIALMSDDLSRIPWLIKHSRKTMRVIKQNIFFSLAIKGAFITMAMFEIATLWGAIAADMGASLLVIFNGLRLLQVRGS